MERTFSEDSQNLVTLPIPIGSNNIINLKRDENSDTSVESCFGVPCLKPIDNQINTSKEDVVLSKQDETTLEENLNKNYRNVISSEVPELLNLASPLISLSENNEDVFLKSPSGEQNCSSFLNSLNMSTDLNDSNETFQVTDDGVLNKVFEHTISNEFEKELKYENTSFSKYFFENYECPVKREMISVADFEEARSLMEENNKLLSTFHNIDSTPNKMKDENMTYISGNIHDTTLDSEAWQNAENSKKYSNEKNTLQTLKDANNFVQKNHLSNITKFSGEMTLDPLQPEEVKSNSMDRLPTMYIKDDNTSNMHCLSPTLNYSLSPDYQFLTFEEVSKEVRQEIEHIKHDLEIESVELAKLQNFLKNDNSSCRIYNSNIKSPSNLCSVESEKINIEINFPSCDLTKSKDIEVRENPDFSKTIINAPKMSVPIELNKNVNFKKSDSANDKVCNEKNNFSEIDEMSSILQAPRMVADLSYFDGLVDFNTSNSTDLVLFSRYDQVKVPTLRDTTNIREKLHSISKTIDSINNLCRGGTKYENTYRVVERICAPKECTKMKDNSVNYAIVTDENLRKDNPNHDIFLKDYTKKYVDPYNNIPIVKETYSNSRQTKSAASSPCRLEKYVNI